MNVLRLSGVVILLAFTGLAACAPEVGSAKWCKQMKEKPKGDWTANEAKDYLKSCILEIVDEDEEEKDEE